MLFNGFTLKHRSASTLGRAALAATLLLAPLTTHASTVLITVRGLVANGTDRNGIFGPKGALLAGKSFTATFVVDDTKGFVDNYPPSCLSSIAGNSNNGSVNSPLVGTLQIGNVFRYFGRQTPDRTATSAVQRIYCVTPQPYPPSGNRYIEIYIEDGASVEPGQYNNILDLTVQPTSSNDTQFATPSWEAALNDSMIAFDGDPDNGSFNDFTPPPNFMDLTVTTGLEGQAGFNQTQTTAAFFSQSIVISGPLPNLPPVIYKPASLLRTGSSTNGGVSPQSATADFNGDGNLDIVTTNLNNSSVSILFGNGDGTFRASVNYTVPSGPFGVVTGDLNGDNLPDIAITSGANASGTNSVSILLNTGGGAFAPVPEYTYKVGLVPYGIVANDLNNDGVKDLVVSNAGSASVSVLIGKGDGSFAPAIRYAVGNLPYTVAVGDLNHDGFPDIATANYGDNAISVLLNDGTGKFLPQVAYPSTPYPIDIAIADVTRDNYPDIILSSLYGNSIQVLANDSTGSGIFSDTLRSSSYNVGKNPFSFVVADMNGDGMPDLTVANLGDSTLSTLLGRTDGTFTAAVVTPAPPAPFSLTLGDFNNDGKPDLSVSTYGPSTGVALQAPPQ